MPTTPSTPSAPSWENLQLGLGALELMVPILDYAMQLVIDTDGKPDTTPIDLTAPQAAFDARIAAYVKAYHAHIISADELRLRTWRCTKCGLTYFRPSGNRTCPTVHGDLSRCGGEMEEQLLDVGEGGLRERARPLVCAAEPARNRQAFVSAWIVSRVHRDGRVPDRVCQPLKSVLRHCDEMMAHRMDELRFYLPQIAPATWLDGRQNLLPKGSTLGQKHADYSAVRENLVSLRTHLAALTADHPEFVALDQQYNRPPTFPPAVTLPPATGSGTAETENGRLSATRAEPNLEARAVALLHQRVRSGAIWTIQALAADLGCSRRQLYRLAGFQQALRAVRAGKEDLPKGWKRAPRPDEPGQIEAYDK